MEKQTSIQQNQAAPYLIVKLYSVSDLTLPESFLNMEFQVKEYNESFYQIINGKFKGKFLYKEDCFKI